jgi:hypothetical protein
MVNYKTSKIMDRDIINEYGISNESIESFVNRNNFPASPIYPQNLKSGQEVNRSNQISFLPIDWETEQDWQKMYQEAKKLAKHYIVHRNHENHKGWESLVIHGLSSVHTESPHTYGFTNDDAPWRWTDVADYCPTIVDFFKNNFDYEKYYRVRIMKLKPGGYIIPHKDSLSEEENHIGPINLALNHPDGCKFMMDNIGILPWHPGRFIKLNLYNVHAVYNDSPEDRYHVIIHGVAGKSWPNRIYKNYQNWKQIYA